MNRDGFRAGRRVAEHEAAHAIIGILSGLVVNEVTIAPAQHVRRQEAGHVDIRFPAVPMPTPLTATALIDAYAAGCAWELVTARCDGDRENARARSAGDRSLFDPDDFEAATRRTAWRLLAADVQEAVLEVAGLLQAGKSGSIFGTTVERVLLRRGLVPALDESWRAQNQTAVTLAPAVHLQSGEGS